MPVTNAALDRQRERLKEEVFELTKKREALKHSLPEIPKDMQLFEATYGDPSDEEEDYGSILILALDMSAALKEVNKLLKEGDKIMTLNVVHKEIIIAHD